MVRLEIVAFRANLVNQVHKVPQVLLDPVVPRAPMASLDREVPKGRMEFRESTAQQDQLDRRVNRAPKAPRVVLVQRGRPVHLALEEMWELQVMLDNKEIKVLQESRDLQDPGETPDLLARVDFLANQGNPVLRARPETQVLLVQQDVMEVQVTLDLKVRMDREVTWVCLDQVDLEGDQGQGETLGALDHLDHLEPLGCLAHLDHLGQLVLLETQVLKERLDPGVIQDLKDRKDPQDLRAGLCQVIPETQGTQGHRDLQEMQVQLDLLDPEVMLGL